MAAVSWLLMLCLVHDRPVDHLPITAVDTADDSQQLDKKVVDTVLNSKKSIP